MKATTKEKTVLGKLKRVGLPPVYVFSTGQAVRLVDAFFPDGEPVDGVWTVIGRKGEEIYLERMETVIRCPESCAVLASRIHQKEAA